MIKVTWFKSETKDQPDGEPGEREYPALDIFETSRVLEDLRADPRTIQVQVSRGGMSLIWVKNIQTGTWDFQTIGC